MGLILPLYQYLLASPVVSHILLAVPIQLLFGVPLWRLRVPGAWWIGAAMSIGFWWGRKKIEFEYSLIPWGPSHNPVWHLGWTPFEWPADLQWQFYAPATVNLLLAWLLTRMFAARRIGDRSRPASR
jgi:hypothetical protein